MIGTGLPQWLLDMIASVPTAGAGVHLWLYKVARQLHAHRDEDSIVQLLKVACDGCGRSVPEHEIRDAVVNSQNTAWRPPGTTGEIRRDEPRARWPEVNHEMRKRAIEGSALRCVADLWHQSPTICSSEDLDAEWFVDQLFPGNPLLCIGVSNSDFATAPREDFRGKLSKMSLVVPSPMSALTGKRKKDGAESAHTLENTGPRRYLVTEFDAGTADEQSATIWHLRKFAPLVMVLSSGGKSLHAWWNCGSAAAEKAGKFMRYAVSIGADPATWTRSQFVRLPQGWRAGKNALQEVLFFDHTQLKALSE
jgi:hypothetical protein